MKKLFILAIAATLASVVFAQTSSSENWQIQTSSDGSEPAARHESALAQVDGKLYLLGGRGSRNVDRYDPVAKTWESLEPMPLELHHFQAVTVGSRIFVIGAFTCCYPNEEIISDIYVYNTLTETWQTQGSMPTDRVRGSVAAVLHKGKIYVLGGNIAGHNGGAVPWFDEYDPVTGEWVQLDDAPNARDHFMAAIAYGKLVATAGRQTAQPNPYTNAVLATDIYDFDNQSWSTTTDIPTARAGALTIAYGSELIVAGGEIDTTSAALATVEAFDVFTNQWRTLQDMSVGRHSGGGALLDAQMHVVAGSKNRGGSPETTSHELLQLTLVDADEDNDGLDSIDETQVHLTDPQDADTDNDGLEDGDEVSRGSSPLNPDTDGDSLNDGDEVTLHGTDPISADSDNDQLTDDAELQQYQTNPNQSDSDEDGLDDGAEIAASTDPLDTDSDDDGLSDGEEVNVHMTNPLSTDSDSDGLPDMEELQTHGTSPTNNDSDADGLFDQDEVLSYNSDPTKADTDDDGLDDAAEISAGTLILVPDTDLDGLLDGEDDEPLVPASTGKSGGSISILSLLLFTAGWLSRSARLRRQLLVKVLR